MKILYLIQIIIVLLLASCGGRSDLAIGDYVDHWEITRTFETYNNSELIIDTLENAYKIEGGINQVLIISVERNPIFKEGKELSDLYSTKSLLIELDISDSLVSTSKPTNSKLFRKLIAFSPDYGINPLDSNEKMELTRKDSTVWEIESEIYDFVFSAELDFGNRQSLTTRIKDY
ncbi:hypothetical protein [Aquimarina intermedia]|uniref:Uncharacterized protein n=1 Tax=Aquimarina intermedia TaxID=350814 RepID=A0A5S5C5J5_9FLAO|nr:hypothetical protein [Aquimarina intermedia]TYP73666.1 hypothetical protein BD809_105257 [Aquimarina intermedia]